MLEEAERDALRAQVSRGARLVVTGTDATGLARFGRADAIPGMSRASLPGRPGERLREGGSFPGRGFPRGPRAGFRASASKRPRRWRPRSREWTGRSTSSSPTSRAWSPGRTPFRRRSRESASAVPAAERRQGLVPALPRRGAGSRGPAPGRQPRLRPARCSEGRGRVVRAPIVSAAVASSLQCADVLRTAIRDTCSRSG